MSHLRDLGIRAKLTAVVGVVLLLLTLVAVAAIVSLGHVNAASTRIAEEWLPGVSASHAMNTETSDVRVAQYARVGARTPEQVAAAENDRTTQLAKVRESMAAYEKTITLAEDRALFTDFTEHWQAYVALDDRLQTLVRSGDAVGALALVDGDMKAVFDTASADLLKIVDFNTRGADAASAAADAQYASARRWILLASGAAFVVGLALAWVVGRAVARPVR